MGYKCDHDWFDHYMMYSAMSSNKGGGDDLGCLLLMIEAAGGTILMGAICTSFSQSSARFNITKHKEALLLTIE